MPRFSVGAATASEKVFERTGPFGLGASVAAFTGQRVKKLAYAQNWRTRMHQAGRSARQQGAGQHQALPCILRRFNENGLQATSDKRKQLFI